MYAFFKRWALMFCIVGGASLYMVGTQIRALDGVRHWGMPVVSVLQPLLIFGMLFVTFCKVDFHALRPVRWCRRVLLTQTLLFLLPWAVLFLFTLLRTTLGPLSLTWQLALETAFICFVTPTATAAAVVTLRLGGRAETLLVYTIMINLVVTLAVPTLVPLITPQEGVSFLTSFLAILGRVCPMLILPIFAATLVRHWMPRFHAYLHEHIGLAFKLWVISLTMAIMVATRGLVHSHATLSLCVVIGAVSLTCCILQFIIGRFLGFVDGDRIAAAQAFGQKNTALAIWMGYTFLHPASAIAGGFYSVWHNVYNAWQMNRAANKTSNNS